MSLYAALYSADPTAYNMHSVAADNAEKLTLLVNQALAAAATAGEEQLLDINLSGTGAGPNWECWITTGTAEAGVGIALQECSVVAVEGGNAAEVRSRLFAALAALSPSPTSVVKVELAGGGIGTQFMGLAALFTEIG